MNEGAEVATSPADATGAVLSASALTKRFVGGDGSELTVLDGIEVEVQRGEAVAIVGASGAGKSTLLHILGGLDRASSGTVQVAQRELTAMPDAELTALRNRQIGFVFQFHHLLREFTALENVMMPLLIAGQSQAQAAERARTLLDQVGLGPRMQHRSTQLSGGEQQRVAVARALANRPALLLADEPSGNLDTHTAEQLHELFFQIRRDHGVAMVIATHNRELADRADRVLLLKEGQLRSFYPA